MIDIIIPAYNSHATIERTLLSISNQTVRSIINVIIVNDCSDTDYSEQISKFSNLLNIKEVYIPKNSGPGVARQVGIDNSNSPFLMFMDADDIFIDSLAIDGIIKFMDSDPECIMVSANFLEEISNGEFVAHEEDLVWVFSKMYRRSFLDEEGIKFSNLRTNEDLEFNSRIRFNLKNGKYIYYLKDKFIYLWQFKKDSITRRNNFEYSYHTGIIGSIDAKINVLRSVDNKTEKVINEIQSMVINFFNSYCEIISERPDEKIWAKNVIMKMAEFWREFGKDYFNLFFISDIDMAILYNQGLERAKVIPKITFDNFIQLLEEN